MRRQKPLDRRRRPRPVITLVVVAVLGVMTGCGASDESTAVGLDTDGPSDPGEPPWELDVIDHPDTAEEILATLEAMPDEVDGFPGALRDGQTVIYESDENSFGINVLPLDDLREFSGNPNLTTIDYLSVLVENGELETVEYHDIDNEGIAVLVATSLGNGTLQYVASWADPDGEWLFSLTANTPEARTELVNAYVAAAVASTD